MPVIELKNFSQHLSSVDLARALRSKVGGEKTTFDFSGVESVSAVFMEELFGRLMESMGHKMFTEHVDWSGLDAGQMQLLGEIIAKHDHKR